MTLIEFDLTVIAVCLSLITVSILVLAITAYRLLKKLEEGVDTINNQLRPAVISLAESLRMVNSLLSFPKKLSKKR